MAEVKGYWGYFFMYVDLYVCDNAFLPFYMWTVANTDQSHD